MEDPILYQYTKFGSVYINRQGLEAMLMLEQHMGDEVWRWFSAATIACSVERSFVEDVTFRGRPVITLPDVNRVIGFYQRLRHHG